MTTCTHVDQIRDVTPRPMGAPTLAIGDQWVHLRLCMVCCHVGCCDSSKNRHASAHAKGTNDPIAQSFEPGEAWFWCYDFPRGWRSYIELCTATPKRSGE